VDAHGQVGRKSQYSVFVANALTTGPIPYEPRTRIEEAGEDRTEFTVGESHATHDADECNVSPRRRTSEARRSADPARRKRRSADVARALAGL
jgi:hypothetical protein